MAFFEIVFIIFGVFYFAGKDAKYKQKIKEYNKTGWYIKSNQDLENKLFHDYCYKYKFVDMEDVPKNYQLFFFYNEKVMYEYFMSLAARDVWKQGYRPYLFSIMPKEGFDFLEGFRHKYDKRIEEFNRDKVLCNAENVRKEDA